jgi:hypothetical protein
MRTLTIALATSLAASQASAIVNNIARATISPNFSGGSGPVDNIVQHPGTCDSTGSATGGFNSSGDATCHTEYGLIRISSHAVVSVNAGGSGTFRDTITITAPGVPTGTQGTLTFSVHVSGNISASSGSSASSWSVSGDIAGGFYDLSRQGRFNSPELAPAGYSGNAFGTYVSNSVAFQYGFAMPMSVEFNGIAQAANSFTSSGAAQVDPFVLLTWEGIHDVTAAGAPISSYTIASDSGTNWANPYTPPVTCGSADFNCDGDIGTDSDISAFFACLSGACPAAPCTNSADFNGDGDTGTDADIESFFRVLSGGPC